MNPTKVYVVLLIVANRASKKTLGSVQITHLTVWRIAIVPPSPTGTNMLLLPLGQLRPNQNQKILG
jgi:hypothetical protein